MKRSIFGVATVGALAAVLVAGAAVGQGPRAGAGSGPGYGQGNAPRNGNGPGYRAGAAQGPNATAPRYGMGYGMGRGAGGWWNRVTPQTPEQKALVDQVAALHNRIRAANQELRALALQNAPAAQVQAKQQEVASLRSQLQQLTAANQALIQQMGVAAGACNGTGVCDGTGPKGGQGFGRGRMGQGMGPGAGMGAGMGRGMRQGPRDGSGPNPNCPLKTQ